MYFQGKFSSEKEFDFQVGDKVEIILRSAIYCSEQETPIYHSGTISEIKEESFKDGTFPVGIYVIFKEDHLYDEKEEELVLFSDIDTIFLKEYDIAGYGILNDGMALSVKGKEISKVIWFTYQNGSLIPESISDGSNTDKRPVLKEDQPFIQKVMKYGVSQYFSHFVLSNSK